MLLTNTQKYTHKCKVSVYAHAQDMDGTNYFNACRMH